jgi:hypothetical protein
MEEFCFDISQKQEIFLLPKERRAALWRTRHLIQ